MAKVVVDILMLDENDSALKAPPVFQESSEAMSPEAEPMSPKQILEKLKDMDPFKLDDLQGHIYEFLWGPGGRFAHGRPARDEDNTEKGA